MVGLRLPSIYFLRFTSMLSIYCLVAVLELAYVDLAGLQLRELPASVGVRGLYHHASLCVGGGV